MACSPAVFLVYFQSATARGLAPIGAYEIESIFQKTTGARPAWAGYQSGNATFGRLTVADR
jgi:hypothetical protein